MRRLMNVLVFVSLMLLSVRLAAPPPPDAPADMVAFYRTWMSPPWWLVATPALVALVVPWIVMFVRLARER